MSLDVEAFRENGYSVIRGVVPAALGEALVLAIGEVSGLDADRPETWYRDPLLASDIVPMWGPSGTMGHPPASPAAHDLVGAMGRLCAAGDT